MRAFVIAPSQPLVDALVGSLATSFDVQGSTDPRTIKAFAAEGPISAVLITENMDRPGPDALASALTPALGDATYVLVTRGVKAIAPDGPFGAGVSYPVADRIFASNIKRAVRAARAARFDPRAMQVEIELRSIGLDDKTHYEVLEVPADAGVDEVTRAYDTLSLKFHPDRLRRLGDDAREMGMQLYLRIGKAYRTLRSPNARIRYDHALDGGSPPEDEAPPDTLRVFADWSRNANARKYLALAQKALIAEDVNMALAHLRFAQTQDEDNRLIARKIEELAGPTAPPSNDDGDDTTADDDQAAPSDTEESSE